MKRNLLVTLADKNYVSRAKQLFSSVYFNAGWDGDYLLLAHEIPDEELIWFIKKGILVKNCQPLYNKPIGGMSPVLTSKIYLFKPEFKKWQNIIYLDGDITVRGSLEALKKSKGFGSVPDTISNSLIDQVISIDMLGDREIGKEEYNQVLSDLKENYNLKRITFCAGFMVINSEIIQDDTFRELNRLIQKYEKFSRWGEQLIYNIYFYKKWNKLPQVYCMNVADTWNQWYLQPDKIQGLIIHFVGKDKPWITKNYFLKEFKYNLDRAELINLDKIPPPAETWTKSRIKRYSIYLEARQRYFSLVKSDYLGANPLSIFVRKNITIIHYTLKSFWERSLLEQYKGESGKAIGLRHIIKKVLLRNISRSINVFRLKNNLTLKKIIQDNRDDVAVIIALRDRDTQIMRNTLHSINDQDYGRELTEVYIVDYGSDVKFIPGYKKLCQQYDAEYIRVDDMQVWNKSHAINIGIKKTKTKYILSTDVDNILKDNFIKTAVQELKRNPFQVLICDSYRSKEKDINSEKNLINDYDKVRMSAERVEKNNPGTNASITFFYKRLRGYDERYRGWGYEDVDLLERFMRLGLSVKSINDKTSFIHQWHPAVEKGLTDFQKQLDRNIGLFQKSNSILRNKNEWGKMS